MTKVIYARQEYFSSFRDTLSAVARERVYLEIVSAPSLPTIKQFQSALIAGNAPVFYALDGERVVGWIDITPYDDARKRHRGQLGMGLLAEHRGRGIGSKLLKAALQHAKKCGLEKVELEVYTTNSSAIRLYRKFGFKREGLIKRYRKLDGRYFDCLALAKFV